MLAAVLVLGVPRPSLRSANLAALESALGSVERLATLEDHKPVGAAVSANVVAHMNTTRAYDPLSNRSFERLDATQALKRLSDGLDGCKEVTPKIHVSCVRSALKGVAANANGENIALMDEEEVLQLTKSVSVEVALRIEPCIVDYNKPPPKPVWPPYYARLIAVGSSLTLEGHSFTTSGGFKLPDCSHDTDEGKRICQFNEAEIRENWDSTTKKGMPYFEIGDTTVHPQGGSERKKRFKCSPWHKPVGRGGLGYAWKAMDPVKITEDNIIQCPDHGCSGDTRHERRDGTYEEIVAIPVADLQFAKTPQDSAWWQNALEEKKKAPTGLDPSHAFDEYAVCVRNPFTSDYLTDDQGTAKKLDLKFQTKKEPVVNLLSQKEPSPAYVYPPSQAITSDRWYVKLDELVGIGSSTDTHGSIVDKPATLALQPHPNDGTYSVCAATVDDEACNALIATLSTKTVLKVVDPDPQRPSKLYWNALLDGTADDHQDRLFNDGDRVTLFRSKDAMSDMRQVMHMAHETTGKMVSMSLAKDADRNGQGDPYANILAPWTGVDVAFAEVCAGAACTLADAKKAAKQLWWKEASGFEPNCDAEGMECVTAGDLENEGAFNAMRDARLETMYHALGGDTPTVPCDVPEGALSGGAKAKLDKKVDGDNKLTWESKIYIKWPIGEGGETRCYHNVATVIEKAARAAEWTFKVGGAFYKNAHISVQWYDRSLTFKKLDCPVLAPSTTAECYDANDYRIKQTWKLETLPTRDPDTNVEIAPHDVPLPAITGQHITFRRSRPLPFRVRVDSYKVVLRLPLEPNPKYPVIKCPSRGNGADECTPNRLDPQLGTFSIDLSDISEVDATASSKFEKQNKKHFAPLRDDDDDLVRRHHSQQSLSHDTAMRKKVAIAAGRLLATKSHYVRLTIAAPETARKALENVKGMPALLKKLVEIKLLTQDEADGKHNSLAFTKAFIGGETKDNFNLGRTYLAGKKDLGAEGERYPLLFPFFDFSKRRKIHIYLPCEYFGDVAVRIPSGDNYPPNCHDFAKLVNYRKTQTLDAADNFDRALKIVDGLSDFTENGAKVANGMSNLDKEMVVTNGNSAMVTTDPEWSLTDADSIKTDGLDVMELDVLATKHLPGKTGDGFSAVVKAVSCGLAIGAAVASVGVTAPAAVLACLPIVTLGAKKLIGALHKAFGTRKVAGSPAFMPSLGWAKLYFAELSEVTRNMRKLDVKPSEMLGRVVEQTRCTIKTMSDYAFTDRTYLGKGQFTTLSTGEELAEKQLGETLVRANQVLGAENVKLGLVTYAGTKELAASTEAIAAKLGEPKAEGGNVIDQMLTTLTSS